ncbi:MAG: GumC family protein, partial [Maioricimonas sp. JB049]
NGELSPKAILEYAVFVVCKRKWSIIAIFLATVAAFCFGTFLVTPQWEASTKLMVLGAPTTQPVIFEGIEYPTRAEKISSNDLVEILNSDAFAAEIVRRFELDELAREKAQNPRNLREKLKVSIMHFVTTPMRWAVEMGWRQPSQKNFFADAVEELVEDWEEIELIEETSTIHVGVYAETPELAVAISNALSEMLVDKVKEFNQTVAERAFEFVSVQLKNVAARLEEAEQELLEFKNSEKIVDIAEERMQLLTRMQTLRSSLSTNQTEIVSTRARLGELDRQVSLPAARGGSNDDDDYATLRNSIDETEVEREIAGKRATLVELEAGRDHLQQEMDKVQSQLDVIADRELRFERLSRTVASLRERYLNMNQKYLELEVQKFTETPEFDIKVAAPAYIAEGTDYDWPSWLLTILAAILGGTGLSLGYVFFMEYWTDTLDRRRQIEETTGLTILGTVPGLSLGGLVGLCRPTSSPPAPSAAPASSPPSRTSRTPEPESVS